MTPELEALARRAKACPPFEWVPGMRGFWNAQHLKNPFRVVFARNGVAYVYNVDEWTQEHGDDVSPVRGQNAFVPDLSDYATIGCLLGIYDKTRKRRICPDPVYTYAAAYGLTHPKTIEALVTELENTP